MGDFMHKNALKIALFYLVGGVIGGCAVEGQVQSLKSVSASPRAETAVRMEATDLVGEWQGKTVGGSQPDQACTLAIAPAPRGDSSKVTFQLAALPDLKVYSTMSRDEAQAVLAGEPRLVVMRPRSLADWRFIATHKLVGMAYAKFGAVMGAIANLLQGQPGAAGTVLVRAARVEWSILTSKCHFETKLSRLDDNDALGMRLEARQELACIYEGLEPGRFSLTTLLCENLTPVGS